MPNRLAQASLLIVATMVGIATAEFALRHAFHAVPQLDLDIFRKENGLLLLRPNLTRRHVTRYWDVEVQTNHEGWRDLEPVSGRPIVLGLGDSFAFGWGVAREESFYELVESNWPSERPVDVLQASVPGSTTVDQERLLGRLLTQYEAAAVVLAVFVGNDFTENGLGGADRLRVTDGLLELIPLGERDTSWSMQSRRWLARHSRVMQLLRVVQFQWGLHGEARRTWDHWMREFAQIHLREPNSRAAASISETFASLDRIAERCRRAGVPLTVLALPRSFQVDDAEKERMRVALGVTPDALDLDKPQRLLREWADEHGITFVDPLGEFRLRHRMGERLFYSPDAHLTPRGHQVVAETLSSRAASLMASGSEANLERP